jgi:outer membrane lipopolysaccharide assembly protein LptE/RlpB
LQSSQRGQSPDPNTGEEQAENEIDNPFEAMLGDRNDQMVAAQGLKVIRDYVSEKREDSPTQPGNTFAGHKSTLD